MPRPHRHDEPRPGRLQRLGLAVLVLLTCAGPRAVAQVCAPSQIVAADGQANDQFGASVAISGSTAIIGASGQTGTINQWAYIYVNSGGGWALQQKLTAPELIANGFGYAVAIDGDTAVVGADRDSGLASNGGAAYVFVRSGTVWTLQQKIAAADTATNGRFGRQVSISGDTIVVGADNVGSGAGAVYVFTRTAGAWTQQQKIVDPIGQAGDRFGYRASLSGDTFVASAYQSQTRRVLVFVRSAGVWSLQQALTTDGIPSGGGFGESLSIDLDTIAVGAPAEYSDPAGFVGTVRVFTRSGAAWTQQAILTASDLVSDSRFGHDVSVRGDSLVIGQTIGTDGLTDAPQGAAYLFTRSGAAWTQLGKVTAPDGGTGDRFGVAVGIAGGTMLIGASGADVGAAVDKGEAYGFEGRYWVGPDNANWSDAANWSATPGGPGGAGVPGCSHFAVITASSNLHVNFDYTYVPGTSSSGSLSMFGTGGGNVTLTIPPAGTNALIVSGPIVVGQPGKPATLDLLGGTVAAGSISNSSVINVSNGATFGSSGEIRGNAISYAGTPNLTGGTVTAGITTAPDTVITKTTSAPLVISGPQMYAPGTVFESGAGTTTFVSPMGTSPSTANLFVHVNATTLHVNLASSDPFARIGWAAGFSANTPGRVNMDQVEGKQALVVYSFFIDLADGGKFDLNDNSLILQNEAASDNNVAATARLTAYAASGRATGSGGTWSGTGILSSIASLTPHTAVGILNNDSLSIGGTGLPIYTDFRNVPVNAASVLVQFTYEGDNNLDGVIDAADVDLWARGFASGGALKGWVFGDYDYNNTVDLADLSLLAAAYNSIFGNVDAIRTAISATPYLNSAQKRAALSTLCGAPCPADYNCQDGVDLLDIFEFLADWFAGEPRADFNGLNGVDLLDIFEFLAAWFAGC